VLPFGVIEDDDDSLIANVSRSGNLMSQPCNSKEILSNGHFFVIGFAPAIGIKLVSWYFAMSVFIGKY